ncbi:uncharacterized protein LOC107047943 [Diachasma alloeum]|uniref:uncharacterized protein LOC107047943 n=1 Tax=Diachasma alloeum TaxID=454923 RepID=UPI0007383B25|nr:uncharacterized protein LOC107047943 [Diachasma alloeum]
MWIIRDKYDLLRLKSPMENPKDTVGFRRPIILNPNHALVTKLIEYKHRKMLHAPIDTVINVLRERFWILQCRKSVRAIVQYCVTCRRHNTKKMQPKPSGLPENRVRDARVSEIVGVDFSGPMFLRDGTKAWIEWRFNLPASPWWRDCWERLIRLMKDLLKRTLKKSSLAYEDLVVMLCDCEAVINSRPLTYLAEDNPPVNPLSRGLFLQEVREIGVPDIDAVDADSMNRRQRYLQQLREHLRQRFRIDYLKQLQRRPGNNNFSQQIKVGDLVFCGNELQKRLDWPLVKVIQLYPGKDGEVRVVRLKTATGQKSWE